jgi:5'-deoxy-5'-methylthioadenosine phosphorylase
VAIGLIGGSGLLTLTGMEGQHGFLPQTPWGAPSGPLVRGRYAGQALVFLPRHGPRHEIPPHRVNYRANLWALREAGARVVIATAAVGGISQALPPGRVVIPDQLIDYTYGRAHTYFEDALDEVVHVDFTYPYDGMLRSLLTGAAETAGIDAASTATYGAIQGPRLETAAEIDRMERDGCDIVGMTGMPEAALARELALPYAAVAVVVNWAAGRNGTAPITMEDIRGHLDTGMAQVQALLTHALPRLG